MTLAKLPRSLTTTCLLLTMSNELTKVWTMTDSSAQSANSIRQTSASISKHLHALNHRSKIWRANAEPERNSLPCSLKRYRIASRVEFSAQHHWMHCIWALILMIVLSNNHLKTDPWQCRFQFPECWNLLPSFSQTTDEEWRSHQWSPKWTVVTHLSLRSKWSAGLVSWRQSNLWMSATSQLN